MTKRETKRGQTDRQTDRQTEAETERRRQRQRGEREILYADQLQASFVPAVAIPCKL